jgi:hypothetical protein
MLINIVNYSDIKCNRLCAKLLRRIRAFAVGDMAGFSPESTSKDVTPALS